MTALLSSAAALVAAVSAVAVWWLRARMVVVRVEGASMEPTLHGDERVIVRRLRLDRLRTGQIIVVERPIWQDRWTWSQTRGAVRRRRWIVKRLAALPGECVPEALARFDAVPPGFGLVLGDNTRASTDSREFGPVPLDRVLGVAVRRFGRGGAFPDSAPAAP